MRRSICLLAVAVWWSGAPASQMPAGVTWRLDSAARVGAHAVTIMGAPKVVDTELGPALEFNGESDGLLVRTNPLQGLSRFTIEVIFQPDTNGPEEQRFLHIEERGSASRALIELRMDRAGAWALDTYLRAGETGLTLLNREKSHPAGRWYAAALTYDGRTMTHYVDGVPELSGEIRFPPLGEGMTSIGVRQNKVSWFKGRIHTIRISTDVRPPGRMLRAAAMSRRVIPLWPEGVPGAKPGAGDERLVNGRVHNVQQPTLTLVPPLDDAAGTAVIVCPGGSYARLAIANEAEGVASVLGVLGVTTFILKYRLVEYGHPAPLQDALRAVRMVRARAAEFGLKEDRIGLIGASAGGHLAASAATMYDAAEGRTGASLDAVSARPDLLALLYPVITMEPPFAHADSRRNLLGAAPDPALVERLSIHRQVRRDMPPVFLVHTSEDASVPIENSLLLLDALRRHGVPVEAHFYERGPHGFGTRADLGPASGWVDSWLEWLRGHGWIGGARP